MSAESIRLVPYVPRQLRWEVMRMFHDDPRESAHLGEAKTHKRILEHFYWPGMAASVNRYVSNCRACQLTKRARVKKAGLLKPIPPLRALGQVSMDLLDASTTTPDGFRHVIVLTDGLTGFLMAVPVKNKSSKEAVRAFSEWTRAFRYPHTLITDNGTNFVKGDLPRLLREKAVHLKTSLPYRAQGNGRAERAVQVVKNLITANSIDDDRPWDKLLPEVTAAYNASKHSSTQFSPHFLLYGEQPEMAIRAEDGSYRMEVTELPPTPEDKAELIQWFRAVARINIAKAQARQKIYFDHSRRVRRFEPGAIVKLLKHPQQLKKKKQKFVAPFIGPLVIESCERDDVYRLRTMDGKRLKGRSVNVERIFPYFAGDDVPVETPRARNFESSRQPMPQPVPSSGERSAEDDDPDDNEDPPIMVMPHESPLTEHVDLDVESRVEPENPSEQEQQQPEVQVPITEPEVEQAIVDEQDQPPEPIAEPDVPSDTSADPTIPPEPELPTRQRPTRNRRPPDRLLERIRTFIGCAPRKEPLEKGSSVTIAG
jgi:transposase InsO family protein